MNKSKVYEPISTGTTVARDLRDRFADIVNVKDYGAKGDGSSNDNDAFTAAYAAGKAIYVPHGIFMLESTNAAVQRCYGEGVLHFSNGLWHPLKTPGNNDAMASRVISEFNFGGGSESTVQAMCILDDICFMAQNVTDNYVTISQFNMPAETDTQVTINLAQKGGLTPVVQQDFNVGTTSHCGLMHAEWADDEHTQATLLLVHGSILSTVTWDMATPASSTISNKNESANFYRMESRSMGAVSTDKKRIAFCGYKNTETSASAPTYFWVMTVYDYDEYINRASIVYPIAQYYVPRINGRTTLSGLAMDSHNIYILSSSDNTYTSKVITVLDRESGREIKDIPVSGALAHPDLLDAYRFGAQSHTRFYYMQEAEGLTFWKDNLVFYDKYYTILSSSFCTFNGNTFVCIKANSNTSPTNSNYWHRIDYTPNSTPAAWNPSTSYSPTGSQVYTKTLIGIAPAGLWPVKETPLRSVVSASTGAALSSAGRASFDATDMAFAFGHLFQGDMWCEEALIDNNAFYLFNADNIGAGVSNALIPARFQKQSDHALEIKAASTDTLTYEGIELYPTFHASRGSSMRLYGGGHKMTLNSSGITCHSHFWPGETNDYTLGKSGKYWADAYITSGSHIGGSDKRIKDDIEDVNEALMRAWGKVRFVTFKMREAIEKKGREAARIHVGCIAQEIQEAFASEGLDAARYGLFCHDSWEAEPAEYTTVEIHDEEGNVTGTKEVLLHPAKPAGDMYALRYGECLALECAYQRWRLDRLEAIIFNN